MNTEGTVVEAGGERVHVVEDGPADGPPLLVSSGLGSAWFDWKPTVELLRARHRVVNFDRPGLGLSPVGQAPPSLRRDVAILAGLARRERVPVTLVAHSMAGFHAEGLARLHPELVRALVLVDPSYERDPCSLRVSAALNPAAKALGSALEFTRAAKLVGPLGRRLVMRQTSDGDAPADPDEVESVYGRGEVLGTVLAEELAYREMAVDLDDLRGRRPFPPIPMVVLTALGDVEGDKARDWADDHATLAAMTPHGRQVRLPETRHMIQLDNPEAVADAVAEVLRTPPPGLGTP
ncbi:alpha/beta fold hydrolase [Spirillospora sp. CA-294931]|uniref:alpha/beta fold hydrolase n=1 Tax=Spirillospora sp. CA-294931 TaxID=3240042 RepID=UPI003D8B6B9C